MTNVVTGNSFALQAWLERRKWPGGRIKIMNKDYDHYRAGRTREQGGGN
jgi:hypothetical protein